MSRHLTVFLAAAVICGAVSTAHAITPLVIDDFDNPATAAQYFTLDTNSSPDFTQWAPKGKVLIEHTGTDAAGVPGGERDVFIDVTVGSALIYSASGEVGNGHFDFVTSHRTGTQAILQYDGEDTDSETGLLFSNGLNLDLTQGGDNDAFIVAFDQVVGGLASSSGTRTDLQLKVQVTGAGGTAEATTTVADSGGPTEAIIPFADFTGGNPFADASSVTVWFNSNSALGVDLTVDYIGTTSAPEPSTIAMLGMLLCFAGGWGYRRWRKRS